MDLKSLIRWIPFQMDQFGDRPPELWGLCTNRRTTYQAIPTKLGLFHDTQGPQSSRHRLIHDEH